MTYCVAMNVSAGLVFLSDTRTNAGIDHVSTFRKMAVFEQPGERVLVLMSAGNLALTQSVTQRLSEYSSTLDAGSPTLWSATSVYEAARVVGEAVRDVFHEQAAYLKEFDVNFNCNFILGGQILGQPMRLFQIYSAGNFIETSALAPYFQIGEAKYGKPIIDRVVTPDTPLDEVTKCALVSMDSTLRSNVSVGLPLDLLVYEKDSLRVTKFASLTQHSEYYQMIHNTWGERLRQVFGEIPNPVWTDAAALPLERRGNARATLPRAGAPAVQAPDVRTAAAQTLAQSGEDEPPK